MPNVVPYSVLLSPEKKKQLRILAIKQGTTVPVIMRRLVDDYLEKSA
jgi:predicted DNA-binding protein